MYGWGYLITGYLDRSLKYKEQKRSPKILLRDVSFCVLYLTVSLG